MPGGGYGGSLGPLYIFAFGRPREAAMPALFLSTLYEYSPFFHISLVFVCFVVTCGLVLGWFAVDVPVILRTSDESMYSPALCRKRMIQVKNPFRLEISNAERAAVSTGVTLRPHCLEESTLTCYWGCSVQRVQEALRQHVYCSRIVTPGGLEGALCGDYLHRAQHPIQKESEEDIVLRLPEGETVEDFGPVPRTRYPLLALLTLAQPEDREIYPIVSMVSVIHIPDRGFRLPCRVLYQCLLTAQGQLYDLKQLYMSAASEAAPEPPEPEAGPDWSRDKEWLQRLEEEGRQDERSRDCVVCQNDTVNWVLLPCRHVCVCDACLTRVQHCPMCRQFVQESFALRCGTPSSG